MTTDYKISELAAATTVNDVDLFTSVQASINKKVNASIVADYVTTSKTYAGFTTTAKTIQGAVNELKTLITTESLWDRALLGGSVYYVTPQNFGDILKIKSNIYLGGLDAFSRTQFWNYETNSIIRLGALQSDGDPINATSEGSVFYGQNAQGDAMTSSDFGYARIKPNRIGLYNAKSIGYTGYLFRLDTITNECYLKDNSGNTTFNFDRSTGVGTLYGIWSYNSHPMFTSDTQLVDKKYVDDAVSGENLWDELIIPTFYTVVTPHTSTDRIQVPTITGSGTYGGILYTDLDGNKTITAGALTYTGAGLILTSSSPYFKIRQSLTNASSGIIFETSSDNYADIYHKNALSSAGDSTLDFDAKPYDGTYASLMRFGYNTTASNINFDFYGTVTTRVAFQNLAYTGATLDNTIFLGTDTNHGVSKLSITNNNAGFAYFDFNIFTNNSYFYIGRLTNPRASASYPNQYIYNYHLQRNIRFAAAGANANMLETWNENDLTFGTDLTGTSSTIAMYQRVASGSIVGLGQITWTCENAYQANPNTHYSGVRLYNTFNGGLVPALYISNDQSSYFYNAQSITYAGDLKSSTSFVNLINTAHAADMDGTGTGIYVGQTANDNSNYDCGLMSWECETDWTATLSTRNSAIRFQAAKSGVLTTVAILSPNQGVYFYNPVYISSAISGANPLLNLTSTSGVAAIYINQNNATKSYTGYNLQRQSVEKWFVGMNDATDDFQFRRNASTNDFTIINSNGDAVFNRSVSLHETSDSMTPGSGYGSLSVNTSGFLSWVINHATVTTTPFVLYTDTSGTYLSVRSASSALQSAIALYSDSTENWFISSANTLNTPNNRLTFTRYNGSGYDENFYLTSDGNAFLRASIYCQGNISCGATYALGVGDPGLDGSWRLIISGSDLLIQRRISSVWTTKSTITG